MITVRRFICVILAAIIMFSIPACGGGDIKLDPKKPVTVTLWHYYHGVQQTALDGLVRKFNTTKGLELGIIVEASSFGGVGELAQNVLASAKGDVGSLPMPNMFSSYSDSAYELAQMDMLSDIGEFFTEQELSEYIEAYLSEGRILDSRLMVFPVAKASEIFILNKTDWDIFAEAVNKDPDYPNVSLDDLSTWEGILKASEIYYNWTDAQTPALNDGTALFGLDSSANYFYTGARQLGHDIVSIKDGETEIVLDKEVIRKLWETFCVPMYKGHFASLGRFRSDDVKTGDMLCFVGSTASAAYFPSELTPSARAGYEIEAYVSSFPVFKGAKSVAIQQGAGMCVSKSDPVKEYASAQFLKWFTETQQNIEFAVSSAGYLPVKKTAVQSETMHAAIQTLHDSTEKSGRNLAAVMTVFADQTVSHELYANPASENTAKIRAVFEAVRQTAADTRARLLDSKDYDAELKKLTDDAAFEEFYSDLKRFVIEID